MPSNTPEYLEWAVGSGCAQASDPGIEVQVGSADQVDIALGGKRG
jgi:hypothetical protein